MTIPVYKEHEEMASVFGTLENCHFCKKPTHYWHENTNNPVCRECAKKYKVANLPDFGQKIRASKRRNVNIQTG